MYAVTCVSGLSSFAIADYSSNWLNRARPLNLTRSCLALSFKPGRTNVQIGQMPCEQRFCALIRIYPTRRECIPAAPCYGIDQDRTIGVTSQKPSECRLRLL